MQKRLQIAESFRRFGISDDTESLLAVKVSTNPHITQAAVKEHLTTAVQGISVDLSDENLADLTNLSYLKKVYKLGNDSYIKRSNTEHGNGAKQASHGENEERRRLKEYMESVILGIIALKGW